MKKQMRKMMAAALALLLVLGTSAGALETTNGAGVFENIGDVREVEMEKVVTVPKGLTLTDETFTFRFTYVEELLYAASAPVGSISDVTIAIAEANEVTPAPSADYDTYANTGMIDLSGLTFAAAGIYVFKVTEVTPGTPTANVKYSEAEYELHVFVKNDVDVDGNILSSDKIIAGVEIYKIKDDAGDSAGTNTGTEQDPEWEYEKADMVFTNTYSKNASLTISKEVLGAYASESLQFEYDLTINIPGAADDDTVKGYILREDGTNTEVVTFTVTGGVATTASDIKLAHGDKLIFDGTNNSTLLPVGATYVLTETGTTGYTPSVEVGYDSTVSGTATAASAGDSLTVGASNTITEGTALENPILIQDGANYADWTNEYEEVSPTGILMDNLPFILMMAVAVGGLVGYLVLKRRAGQR